MTEAHIQLQNALTTTFLANLTFLSEYDNDLYQRVEYLSRMIEIEEYKSRYELEFIKEKGDFDIYDKGTNSYLYNKNPKNLNDKLVDEIDFSQKNTILNLENYFMKHENSPTIDILQNYKFGEYGALLEEYMQEYSKNLNDFLDNKSKKFKKVEKFVFFGVLLGRHIPKISQKIDANIYMVFEKNLEIFRLSLFTVDYSILAKNGGVVFSIMDDVVDVEKKIKIFLDANKFNNYGIKYSALGVDISEYHNLFINILSSSKSTLFSFLRYLYTYINRTTNYIENSYNFLLFNELKNKFNFLKDISVLFIAAGPSLDENIDWIYNNQDKFFIVTVGSAYKKLVDKDINIDLVTTLDDQKWLERRQFPDDVMNKSDKNTVFLASSQSSNKLLEKLKDKNLFLFEQYIPFHESNYTFDGYSIGEITLDILLNLNIRDIYLIGLDLAVHQKTGYTHSFESNSGILKLDLESEINNEVFDTRKNLIKVRGNITDYVYTTPVFFYSIKDAESKIINKNEDTKIYNLSSHGAYIEGTIPLKIEDINTKNFNIIDKMLLNFKDNLNTFRIKHMNKNEQIKFKETLEFLQNDLKHLIIDFKNYDFKNYEEFKEIVLDILNLIRDNDKSLNLVLYKYYEALIPYLNYHFNDAKLNQEYKKINKIKNIFASQLENLVNDYILCIERIV